MQFKDIIKLPYIIAVIAIEMTIAAFAGIVSRPQGWTYKRYILISFLRFSFRTGLLSIMISSESTLDVYLDWTKKHGVKPESVKLDAGAFGCWLGPSNAKKVLIWFHGGGYIDPAVPGHFDILNDVVKRARKESKDLSVFAISYGRTPKSQYPLQLTRAAFALRHLIDVVGLEPQQIYIGGDSAGGNLAIALLSHILHPHPSAPKLNLHSNKLAGVYLMSPWVTFAQNSPSMKTNKNRDYMPLSGLLYASNSFMSNSPIDAYNTPLSAPPEWWLDLPVSEMCVCAGEYEVFFDDCKEFARSVGLYNAQVEFYEAKKEVHDEMLPSRILGLGIAASEVYFKEWMLTRV